MDLYSLSRNWFDWCFENPEKISVHHTAIYFFAIEHCNRLGWKSKFGFPSQMTMEALGIKKHQTYIKYFNDLVEWGFFILVQKSRNQYSANIISLNNAIPKNGKALDKANTKHRAKQIETTGQSNGSIDIQDTNIQSTIIPVIKFDSFYNEYPLKKAKIDGERAWNKLSETDKQLAIAAIPKLIAATEPKYYPFPATFLNGKRWLDDFSKPYTDKPQIRPQSIHSQDDYS